MYISAEKLGENVELLYRRYEAQDMKVLPLDFAADYVTVVRLCIARCTCHYRQLGTCMLRIRSSCPQ